jgi:hypothetical protein
MKVVIVGDTHATSFYNLPHQMIQLIEKAEWVIHVGDYTSPKVLHQLKKLKGEKFKGVYGNADTLQIRREVPSKQIIYIAGRKIGITHPSSGGPLEHTRKKVLNEFRKNDLDIILYGHTHESGIERVENMLLINPGKGYLEESFYGPPTTLAILTISGKLKCEIKRITA